VVTVVAVDVFGRESAPAAVEVELMYRLRRDRCEGPKNSSL
jgi:hypothetical protein